MATDNTLGAPTEGLGQTVTFAGGNGKGVPQATAEQRGSVRNSAQGGGARRSAEAIMPHAPVGNTTFQVLARLGGDLIKPQLEAERQLSYAKGYQQAAQGQAITEIVDEQPWYSKVFGSTSLVDGARAYSASAKATAVVTDMEANMPELRKLGANEMAQWTAKAMSKAASTGDATTDAMIYHQLGQTLPTGLKSQAKAHLHYQGEMLGEGVTNDIMSKGSLLGMMNAKARDKQDITDYADEGEARIEFSKTFQRPETMPKETHNKLVAEAVVKMLGTGNFAAMTALKQSGKYDELDANQQYAINRATAQASLEAKAKIPIDLFVRAVDWKTMSEHSGVTWEDQLKERDTINQEHTRLTGDPSLLLDNATTAKELLQRRANEEAERKRLEGAVAAANKPILKADAEQALINHEMGKAIAGSHMVRLDKKEQQQVFDTAALYLQPSTMMAFRARQAEAGILDENLRDSLAINANSAKVRGDPVALDKVYQTQYLPMVQLGGGMGEAMALMYAGENKDLLSRYHKAARGQPAKPESIGAYYSYAMLAPAKEVAGKHGEAVQKSLASGRWEKSFSMVGRVFGGDTYPLENASEVKDWIANDVAKDATDMDAAVDAALRISPTVTKLGRYGIQRTAGATDPKWFLTSRAGLGSVPTGQENHAMQEYVDYLKDTLRLEDGIKVGQAADIVSADGKTRTPVLYLMGEGSDKQPVIMPFTGDQIVKRYHESRVKATNKATANRPMWSGDDPIAAGKFN